MKIHPGPVLAAGTVLAMLMSITACTRQESTAATPASSAGSSVASSAAAAPGNAPDYFLQRVYVCDAWDEHGWDHHIPQNKAYFQIVKIDTDSGLYALKPEKPEEWQKGWRALALNVVGSQPAKLPATLWAGTACRPGQDPGGDAAEPDANTIRLRGGVCLPEGNPDHVAGRCDNDVIDPNDPKKSIYRYHEVVVFAQEAGDHMIIQHCSRGELGTKVACPPFTKPVPPARAELAPPGPAVIRAPHPGHIHIEP